MKERSKKPVNARFREVVDRKPSLLRASKWFLFSFSSLLPCGGSKAKDNGKTRGLCTLGSSILSRNEEILIKLLPHDSSHCSEKYARRCSFFQRVLKKERRKPESHYSILNVSKNGRVETANDASVENENFCAKRERVSANFYASSFVTWLIFIGGLRCLLVCTFRE